jgi:hypothetical protein
MPGGIDQEERDANDAFTVQLMIVVLTREARTVRIESLVGGFFFWISHYLGSHSDEEEAHFVLARPWEYSADGIRRELRAMVLTRRSAHRNHLSRVLWHSLIPCLSSQIARPSAKVNTRHGDGIAFLSFLEFLDSVDDRFPLDEYDVI